MTQNEDYDDFVEEDLDKSSDSAVGYMDKHATLKNGSDADNTQTNIELDNLQHQRDNEPLIDNSSTNKKSTTTSSQQEQKQTKSYNKLKEENDDSVELLDDVEIGKSELSASQDMKPPPISRKNWIRIIIIFTAVLSDGLSLTLVQPFLPAMLMNKWGFPESDVGYLSGILIGIYSLARFFSGFYLGHLSDKFGRKKFLVLSLLSTGIGTIIFAVMPNVVLAIAVRFVEGLLSNTTALCQATLADMVDKKNRAAIFAYMGGVFALSRCLSSSIGGITVKIVEGSANPYLLPCVFGGSIVLVSAVLIIFIHPETHPKFRKPEYDIPGSDIPNHEEEDEKQKNKEQHKDYTFMEGIRIISKNKPMVLLITMGCINSFNNGSLLLAIVLFASLSIEQRGLGFDSFKIGIIFTFFGFIGFFFQIMFFKRLSTSLGLKKQYLIGMIFLTIGMALLPLTYTGYLIQGEAMVWVFIFLIMPLLSIGFMQGLPIVQGMVANASDPEIQGLTQGFYQSMNSFLRAFGPAISGAIFSYSTRHSIPFLLFVCISFLYICIAIFSLYVPDSVDVTYKKKKKSITEDH
ncbi:hypothetical protein CYY_005464 [Polysphondylium violaceum]|uniref:Major facilitator superfamily (MFS) profile domain-containing protein n=1 Tax=Polysphondylium violaceum TaxID=133409 RepID=A0A8J4UZK6_9MYCE|nr:hypothetical protein CYY_005464 [Polysphondylium violaceum]